MSQLSTKAYVNWWDFKGLLETRPEALNRLMEMGGWPAEWPKDPLAPPAGEQFTAAWDYVRTGVWFGGGSGNAGSEPLPVGYYRGTDEKKQIEYIFSKTPSNQSWSSFSESLINEVGKNLKTIEFDVWALNASGGKVTTRPVPKL